jgi:hypothetical protein
MIRNYSDKHEYYREHHPAIANYSADEYSCSQESNRDRLPWRVCIAIMLSLSISGWVAVASVSYLVYRFF